MINLSDPKPPSVYTEEEIDIIEQDVRRARYLARKIMPYYTTLLHAMNIKIDEKACYPVPIFEEDGKTKVKYEGADNKPKCTVYSTETHHYVGTAAVDKNFRSYWHPGAVKEWMEEAKAVTSSNPCKVCGKHKHHPLAYVAGIMVHEMCHPMRKHFVRAEQFKKYIDAQGKEWPYQPQISNIAMDLEINDNIKETAKMATEDFFCITAQGCFPDSPEFQKVPGMAEELLYEEYYRLFMENPDKKVSKHPNCGSGAGNEAMPCEEGASKEGEPGFDGVKGSEVDVLSRQAAEQIQEHAAKNPGKVPAGLLKWANALVEPPKIHWRQQMKKLVRYLTSRATIGTGHRSYHKLHRISSILNHEVIIPSEKKVLPEVTIIRDTSGSMCSKSLQDARNEINGILKTVKANVTFIDVDTVAVVSKVKKVSQTNAIRGGGGTDMVVGWNQAKKQKNKPNLVIFLTDGGTPWMSESDKIQGCTVLCCLCGPHAATSGAPSWMRILEVKD